MKTTKFDFDNVGGLARIFAIPTNSLLRIRRDYVRNKRYLEVKNRKQIVDVAIYADSSFSFSEEQTYEDGGLLYNVEISGVIPKIGAANDTVIRTLERGEWLVLHQDRNGTVQLSGTLEVPLRFASSKTSGDTADSLSGYAFKFTASEPDGSMIITLDSPDEL
ncbi:MAG: hypothetical protein RR206_04910 [Bacteroidaceae bacterium]